MRDVPGENEVGGYIFSDTLAKAGGEIILEGERMILCIV